MYEKKENKGKKIDPVILVLAIVAAVLVIAIIVMILLISKKKDLPTETTVPETTVTATEATEETMIPTETTLPVETEPVMLAHLVEYYEENPDIAGWITIEGTKLDDPVMFTPEDEEKYIYVNFNGIPDPAGLPFIDKDCSLDPESTNIIIYGHNMLNGTMFASAMKYENKEFWEANPIIKFSTLYEEREYEVFAAFYDKIYKKSEDVFKFYEFVGPEDEEAYNEAITYFKNKTKYDTGITPAYGENIIMLVTCAYNDLMGRFVVVAREKTE